MSNELKIFQYNETDVRTVFVDGEPWWVLKDVCGVLGLSNPTIVATRLDSDEVTKFDLGGLSGESNIVNESGLYNVIFRSDKPEAKQFKRWITHEVLPTIRKTGGYVANEETFIEVTGIWSHLGQDAEIVKTRYYADICFTDFVYT